MSKTFHKIVRKAKTMSELKYVRYWLVCEMFMGNISNDYLKKFKAKEEEE
jgi:hypothetical protein